MVKVHEYLDMSRTADDRVTGFLVNYLFELVEARSESSATLSITFEGRNGRRAVLIDGYIPSELFDLFDTVIADFERRGGIES